MSTIQFISDDPDFMKTLSEELARDLQNAGIADDLQVSEAQPKPSDVATRGDMFTLTQAVVLAVSAGGALTVALGKDGFLTALANVLGKYVEGRQAKVVIEKNDGEKIQLSGEIGEVKEILKNLKE